MRAAPLRSTAVHDDDLPYYHCCFFSALFLLKEFSKKDDGGRIRMQMGVGRTSPPDLSTLAHAESREDQEGWLLSNMLLYIVLPLFPQPVSPT